MKLMSAVLAWAQGLVFAGIAAGIMWIISPGGSLERTVKTVIAVFIITVLFLPLIKTVNTDFLSESVFEGNASEYVYGRKLSEELCDETEQVIALEIKRVLDGEKTEIESIAFETKTDENGLVIIESVRVTLKEGGALKAVAVKKLIRDELNINVTVTEDSGGEKWTD